MPAPGCWSTSLTLRAGSCPIWTLRCWPGVDKGVVLFPIGVLGFVELFYGVETFLLGRCGQAIRRIEGVGVCEGLGQRLAIGELGAIAFPLPEAIGPAEREESIGWTGAATADLAEEASVLTGQLNPQLRLHLR